MPDDRLKQHWQKTGKDMFEGMRGAFGNPDGTLKPMGGAQPPLADILSSMVTSPDLAAQAGINDVGRVPGMNYLDPASAPQAPMPLDPRMLAYQNQQNEQLAQQAWQRQPEPPTQMAQQPPPQPEGSSWAEAFYNLIRPGLPGSGTAGPRY